MGTKDQTESHKETREIHNSEPLQKPFHAFFADNTLTLGSHQ